MSQTNIFIYRTGDYGTPEAAKENGALYEINVDCNAEHISTMAGFDIYDIFTTIEMTAKMFGYAGNEYEVVLMPEKDCYLTLEQYEMEYCEHE